MPVQGNFYVKEGRCVTKGLGLMATVLGYTSNMATTAGMSLEQFLATHFDSPEPDFVDGEVIPRSMPNVTHGRLQWILASKVDRAGRLLAITELRVRLSDRSYVIDVCVYPAGQELPEYPSTPPLIAAEILSMDDRHRNVIGKLDAYHKWGVKHVWLVDPWSPQLNVYDERGLIHVPAYEVPEFGIHITLQELMSSI